jgi:hypothetical protein
MVGGTAFLFKNSRDSLSRTSMWDHPIAQTPVQGAIFTANAVIARRKYLTRILNRDSLLF